ncbi:MAG: S9 family peptidase, partial [Chloroflexi bacterium CFX7]|nr:S9 family peptidase [Chloroflexi bacterium CFX7]
TGDSVLLYDRFDLWQVFPDGRPARNVTAGYGREQKIQLRLQNIEPIDPDTETHGIDPSKPLYLRGESEVTRATGFFRTMLASTGAPDRLLWEDKSLSYVGRAADADKLLLTGSRFDEFPDILSTSSSFARPEKVSNGGAQLAPFAWGSAELMTYRNADGVELQAALCKPADFDRSKKYPLIVYIYERLSQTLHTFTPPAPSQLVNPTVYTSNGYLVLMPDIVYNVGQPGPSAVKCVLPAVETLIARGFVDEKAIGIQGHSWGGYQIAFLVTQTHLFRAAAAGAVVSNMTSAYSGIRWASGRARQFQYEKTQSRIGRPLNEAPHLYLENSPLFGVDRVTTPLLLLHNDHDDAVPWQQGIEFFLALRRLGKEAYLFNYNNALHGLRRRADQVDYGRRMRQFFDHFLKGAPAPDWMTSGIPYLDRDAEKLRFRDAP